MRKENKPSYVIVHHSAVSQKANPDQLNTINEYHKKEWNYPSSLGFFVGYHILINSLGKINICANDNEEGVHCKNKGMNFKSIGICLEGDFDKEKPTNSQIYALRDILIEKCQKYGIPKENILGHNETGASTNCPGKNLDMNFVRTLSYDFDKKESVKKRLIEIADELKNLSEKL